MKINYNKKLFNESIKKINFKNSTPNKKDILNAFKLDSKIKIIILGQDPYPKKNLANGLAFGVNEDQKTPPSLKQILKEVEDKQGYIKTKKNLKHWTKQGIFLLNTSLTTEINKSNAHKNIWNEFTKDLIINLGKEKEIIWILWGKEALKYKKFIKSKKIIIDAHPSPLSRKYRKENTFLELEKYINIEL